MVCFREWIHIDAIVDTGIITEQALINVYDAYAHTSARLFTERWDEPTTRMCCLLYIVSGRAADLFGLGTSIAKLILALESLSRSIMADRDSLDQWHIVDDRHTFLRRAILGWPKTRKSPPDQREGDFDEVFDEAYHTTGFSRPYEFACDGGEICDKVQTVFTQCRPDALETLQRLWADLTTNIIRYVSNGVVDDDLEVKMAEDCKSIP